MQEEQGTTGTPGTMGAMGSSRHECKKSRARMQKRRARRARIQQSEGVNGRREASEGRCTNSLEGLTDSHKGARNPKQDRRARLPPRDRTSYLLHPRPAAGRSVEHEQSASPSIDKSEHRVRATTQTPTPQHQDNAIILSLLTFPLRRWNDRPPSSACSTPYRRALPSSSSSLITSSQSPLCAVSERDRCQRAYAGVIKSDH